MGVLNEASIFHNKGEKGAYKYALKFIRKKSLHSGEIEVVLPLLINIMLIDPKYGNYVIDFMKEKHDELDFDRITEIANEELSNSLKQGLQQETLLFLYMIKKLDLRINGANLKQILESDNDFAIIIGLDLWKNSNNKVIRSRREATGINAAIKDLGKNLQNESYSGSRWLLLYETERHKLIPKNDYSPIAKPTFFQNMFNLGISFYLI